MDTIVSGHIYYSTVGHIVVFIADLTALSAINSNTQLGSGLPRTYQDLNNPSIVATQNGGTTPHYLRVQRDGKLFTTSNIAANVSLRICGAYLAP